MERTRTPVDEHIASLGEDQRHDVRMLDGMLSAAFAGDSRVMWEGRFWGGSDQRIIGYGDMHHTKAGGETVDWFKVGLAAQKRHLTVYVNAVEDGEYLTRLYASRLGKVKVGAASVGFRRAEDVDLQALEELVEHARRVMA